MLSGIDTITNGWHLGNSGEVLVSMLKAYSEIQPILQVKKTGMERISNFSMVTHQQYEKSRFEPSLMPKIV